jgi:hypothetical protein
VNRDGYRDTLVASHPGNTSRLTHAAFSPRLREPRARAIAEDIMSAPHTVPLDGYAALEIGRIESLIESLDAAIEEKGAARSQSLIGLRLSASGRLDRWLSRFGLTPAERAEWAAQLGKASLGEQIRRRLGEADDGRAG